MSHDRLVISRVSAALADGYQVRLRAGGHALLADEPVRAGGCDAGPAPYDLLLSSLAACTAITLRMYAERKGWPLEGVSIEVSFSRHEQEARVDRRITVAGPLSDEQRTRLAEIAERTPVTLTLKSGVGISTELVAG